MSPSAARKPYPSDVSDEEWSLVVPYLTIGEKQYESLWRQISRAGYRRNEPIDVPCERPTLLTEIVEMHLDDLGYAIEDVSRLLHLNVAEFVNLFLGGSSRIRALPSQADGRAAAAWLFAGSDCGGERAASIYTLIATAKLNGVDARAWLADVVRRIAEHPASRLHELLTWNWRVQYRRILVAAEADSGP